METANKTILIIDSGLYTHVAETIAKGFGKTYYFAEWREQFPSSKRAAVGTGLDFERVDSMWPYVDQVDMIAFLDVYLGDLQDFLRSKGYAVWGNGSAEFLELDRWKTKGIIKASGMPVNKTYLITGLHGSQGLIKHLEDNEDRYVKGGQFRGDFESFHHENMFLTQPWLDELQHGLGPRQDIAEFLVEHPIKGVEVGYDGFSIDGKFPERASFGYEDKDAGYIGQVYQEPPKVIRQVCQSLSQVLTQYQARGFLSIEFRQGPDKRSYIIDPCLRCGSPPSESYTELFTNWPQIIWDGAHGTLTEPEHTYKYVAQLILTSDWAKDNWLALEIADSARPFTKLHNHAIINGTDYVVPSEIKEVGGVIGLGNTMSQAIEQCFENAEGIKAYQLSYDTKAFDRIMDKIEEGERNGIPWD